MTITKLDSQSGSLLVGGTRVFPLGLSDPPPVDSTAPNGKPAWGRSRAPVPILPATTPSGRPRVPAKNCSQSAGNSRPLTNTGCRCGLPWQGSTTTWRGRSLLNKIVNTLKAHPGLGVWKGADEPAHGHIPAAGLVAVRNHLKTLDPDHPIAIIQAPRAPALKRGAPDRPLTIAAVRPYAAACDIHGVDIYPGLEAARQACRRPAGQHRHQRRRRHDPHPRPRDQPKSDLDDAANRLERRPPPQHPLVYPTFRQARFMAYDAIVTGARGLFFFGGHLPHAMNPQDRATRLELELLEPRPPTTAPRTSGARTHGSLHRAARRTCDHRQRPRHRRQRTRARRLSLPDRSSKKPARARACPLQWPSSRHQKRHRPRSPRRQSSPADERRPRGIHRPCSVQTAPRARLPLPRHPPMKRSLCPPCRHIPGL